MLLCLGEAQYSLRYFADLAAVEIAIDSTNRLAAPFGVIVPWRFEVLPESKCALSALLSCDPVGSAPRTH